jgi:hypothetical protein
MPSHHIPENPLPGKTGKKKPVVPPTKPLRQFLPPLSVGKPVIIIR